MRAPDDQSPAPADVVAAAADLILQYRDRYDLARDPRAVFAFVYERLTRQLAEALREPGAFDDPAWIGELADEFVHRYAAAMDAIDDGSGAAPKPWLDVCRAMQSGRSYVLEDLIFSMMAHITYDLPNALVAIGLERAGGSRISDYHTMNAVLATKTDEMQLLAADRYQRFLAVLDHLAGNYDEFFTNYGIRLARSVAWYNARRLEDPASKDEAAGSITRSTGAFIDFVRNPDPWWVRYLLRLARVLIPRRRSWPKGPRE